MTKSSGCQVFLRQDGDGPCLVVSAVLQAAFLAGGAVAGPRPPALSAWPGQL